MYRETKWAENALGTPTFKLADLKNKTGFARRARRTQRKDRRKLVGPTSSRSVSLGRPSERLGTPTFKLADLKNKTGFARRARRTQRKDRRKLVGPTSSRSVSLGRPSERLGTPTFKLACSKESSHGDHEGHKEERYLGELTPGLCFLCALCVLCAKHL